MPTVQKVLRGQIFLLGDRTQRAALDLLEGPVDATYSRNRFPVCVRGPSPRGGPTGVECFATRKRRQAGTVNIGDIVDADFTASTWIVI